MLIVLGKPLIIVQDPEMVRDLQVTKNQITDKTGFMNQVAQGVLHHSLVFSAADEKYKAKRSAISHAFYKDRLKKQMEVMKDLLFADIEKWKKQIE